MIKMQGCGAKNILLSKGSDKAVFLDNTGKFYEKEPYSGNVVNTIGCGDSMVAGFIYEYIKPMMLKRLLIFLLQFLVPLLLKKAWQIKMI